MKRVLHTTLIAGVLLLLLLLHKPTPSQCVRYYSKERMLELREQVRGMFQHAYDGYLRYAADYDELRPLTCDGVDTWGSYSLTLIDALDTLAAMGNYTEFRRVALLLEKKMNFDRDINVSVFETNIRIVGGLLSAHLLSKQVGLQLEPGWPCQGPLLRMAEDVAKRLLPAFDTETGMPYGTVNLRYGVPKGETSITCTAGVGTFLIEFGTLSRLTGNSIYEDVALNAAYALWERRSALGLLGNHIDVQSGRWTALDSGIGAGVDSFFEYLVKGSILLQRPELLQMFHDARESIDKHLKRDDWYIWAHMNKGHVSLPVFQSLEAFWPGILSIIGDIGPAMRTMTKYASVWRKFGFLPEFYNIVIGDTQPNREKYPLRPELIESAMYLYRATKNQFLLELGEQMLESIEFSAKTKCGYATIRNVVTHEKENRMESFFLSETTKYLYLLFDEDNFMHRNAGKGDLVQTFNGECVINTGPYIFNTEAHPVDMSALYCCHDLQENIFDSLDLNEYRDDVLLRAERKLIEKRNEESIKYQCGASGGTKTTTAASTTKKPVAKAKEKEKEKPTEDQQTLAVDIEVLDDQNQPAADVLLETFERIKMEREGFKPNDDSEAQRNQLTVSDLDDFFNAKREDFKAPTDVLSYVVGFMRNYTLDAAFIRGLQVFDTRIATVLGSEVQKDYESRMRSLWDLYELEQRLMANVMLVHRLSLLSYNEPQNRAILDAIMHALNLSEPAKEEPLKSLCEHISHTHFLYRRTLSNTTMMQEFLLRLLRNGSNDKQRQYVPLLNDTEIASLPLIELSAEDNLNVFSNVRRLIEFKKRMIETFDKLQNLMQQSIPASAGSSAEATTTPPPIVPLAPEASSEGESTPVATGTSQKQPKLSKSATKTEANNSDSVWTQLMQAILRSTAPKHTAFDEQVLVEKVSKSLAEYTKDEEQDYELFTCERPQYIEMFAYREFYPTV